MIMTIWYKVQPTDGYVKIQHRDVEEFYIEQISKAYEMMLNDCIIAALRIEIEH